MAEPRRSASFVTGRAVELGKSPLIVKGYLDGKAVCRLKITIAGVEFYKGKEQVNNLNWEDLIVKVRQDTKSN